MLNFNVACLPHNYAKTTLKKAGENRESIPYVVSDYVVCRQRTGGRPIPTKMNVASVTSRYSFSPHHLETMCTISTAFVAATALHYTARRTWSTDHRELRSINAAVRKNLRALGPFTWPTLWLLRSRPSGHDPEYLWEPPHPTLIYRRYTHETMNPSLK